MKFLQLRHALEVALGCETKETEPKIERSTPRRDELIFTRYGDSYFLSEVLTAGEQTSEEINPSHRERELRREMMSRNQTQPETVTVAALN